MKKKISITECVACRRAHPDLEFEESEYTVEEGPYKGRIYQALCPVTGVRIYALDDRFQSTPPASRSIPQG